MTTLVSYTRRTPVPRTPCPAPPPSAPAAWRSHRRRLLRTLPSSLAAPSQPLTHAHLPSSSQPFPSPHVDLCLAHPCVPPHPPPFPQAPPLLISSHSLTWQRYKRARGCSHACLLVHSRSVDPCSHTLRAVLRLCLSADDTVAQFESCLRDVPCLHPEPSLVKCGSRWD